MRIIMIDGWLDGWMRNESNFVKEEEKEEEFVILQKGMKWMDGFGSCFLWKRKKM